MAIGIPLIQRILDDFKNGDARQLKLFLQNLYEKVKGIEENVNVKINNVPSLEPTKNTLALRDTDGQMKAQDPTEDDDVVTKGWADSEYAPGTAGDVESAQDAVGSILVDSASVDFTYNDATPSITAAVLPAGVDHAALNNLNSASYTHLTAGNHTELTDGGDTVLHYHQSDRDDAVAMAIALG